MRIFLYNDLMNKEKEIWKDIAGYEGIYKISNLGEVKSSYNKNGIKLLKGRISNSGYRRVVLVKNKEKRCPNVHRLMAINFIENKENKPQVNHIDGNKLNNRLDNLEWSDRSENMKHAYNTGLMDNWIKPVLQYSLSGELIAEHRSIVDAAKSINGCKVSIRQNMIGKSHKSQGFIWKYKNG